MVYFHLLRTTSGHYNCLTLKIFTFSDRVNVGSTATDENSLHIIRDINKDNDITIPDTLYNIKGKYIIFIQNNENWFPS